ncbi:RNA polymerase sigma-70 factor [Algoriphagus sp. Y33]|uniref:RNA polymerase sigma-70 factor n=1 Tax=Algoriphagus sp. Y33 TaxID=2772483 RepID=UPI00177AA674|nr:RNA polymerase sigma-70 factor [Algoriphagus sp. Y33]
MGLLDKIHSNNSSADFRTEAGFKKLYERNVNKLFTICYSRIRNREDAEEIVHDVFRSAWERRELITNENGSIEKYLVRSIKLKTIDYYRKVAQETLPLNCELEDVCGYGNCTDDQLHFAELQDKVSILVDQLPCACRQVYQLSREEGFTNREIASKLLISEKTVESHMTKALAHLRKNLMPYATPAVLLISFF